MMWRWCGQTAASSMSPPRTCCPCATLQRPTLPGAGRLPAYQQVLPHTVLSIIDPRTFYGLLTSIWNRARVL